MKHNRKRLPALLLAIILCLSMLPVTAGAASNFPSKFYASLMNNSGIGAVNSSLTYTSRNTEAHQVYGMEYAGGAFFTVEGKGSDDGFRELRMYNSDLTNSRTIGTVNQANGGYWIIDTAMDLSGAEPVLYGTYNGYALIGNDVVYCSSICQISLTDGKTSSWQTVTGIPDTDIIYAMAFTKDGTLYAISADMGDDGGPASLYTIDKQTGAATLVGAIKTSSGNAISTNYIQDLAFDHATGTLYWAENAGNVLYTVNTQTAVATKVGQVKYSGRVYATQSFCIPYTPASSAKHMISVFCEGEGEIATADGSKAFYMVDNGKSITLNITPAYAGGLRSVKVDGKSVSVDGLVENGYTFSNVTESHVIEAAFKVSIPATQKNVTWLHYQGEPAKFYTVDNVYKFYDLPYLDNEVPREDYTQTLLDKDDNPIDNDTVILPGNYDVHVTHPGTEKYYPIDVIYRDALQLAKCDGTPGRPVVYGKVGCKQGDLVTTSALQDYYGTDGELIDAAHDEIPVTLEWLDPETTYDQAGHFSARANIYAADELDQRLKDCYNLDDGTPLTEGCEISSRATQVVVLPADEVSLIKLETNDASGGTVSGKGVYKNGDQVTVTATANINAGYVFLGWKENDQIISSADATYTFEASGDRTLTAVFGADPDYLVILKTEGEDGCGTVTGGGNYKEDGHSATVTATANPGYYFIGWYEGETLKSEESEYTVTVEESGITLTAKFGIDYLARAEQAKDNFKSVVGTDAFEWQTLVQAVDAYETAKSFVADPPDVIENAQKRFDALTDYYNGIEALDLSDQGIGNDDLAKLNLFTGVTDLNFSGNKGVTDLSKLPNTMQPETLDISGTGVITTDVFMSGNEFIFSELSTLTAQNLSLTSISALAELVSAKNFDSDSVILWDFTGSTLPDTEDNKTDVQTIEDKLGAKFIKPTIKTNPPAGGGGGGGDTTTYSITIEDAAHGTVTSSLASADKGATVTLTVTPNADYELDTLTVTDAKGNKVELTRADDNRYTFTMPGSDVKIAVSFKESAEQVTNPFTDVHESDYYCDAVLWAVANGVTNGTGATTFSPDNPVSRAQMVTFLWRAYGSPKATGSNPFTDVDESAWYYDAVLWAVANGVTNGTSATTFSPDTSVTRAQSVTFQWRAAGSPEASGSSFDDVAENAYYNDAVVWAVASGITVGTGGNNFSPDVVVSRAQAVTFLYRELA